MRSIFSAFDARCPAAAVAAAVIAPVQHQPLQQQQLLHQPPPPPSCGIGIYVSRVASIDGIWVITAFVPGGAAQRR